MTEYGSGVQRTGKLGIREALPIADPELKGVFGRKSGARDDFRYSGPMLRANLVWDEANLTAYIADPQAKVKGNRMPYGCLANTGDVDDIVAYLKILK
jgi:cytochrome c